MSPESIKLMESLIRLAKGMISSLEEWLKAKKKTA